MTHHDYGDIFEWGLKDGNIIHVDEVENGLACNCSCPDCGISLIAFNRVGNKRINHFQHTSKSDCKNAYETALHYLAKQIILETKTLLVPDINYKLSSYAEAYHAATRSSEKKTTKKLLHFTKVEIEKSEKQFRPDLKCYVGDKLLLIEIAVTHFVDNEKLDKVYKNNIPLLEIDLSGIDRLLHKDKLKEILHGKHNKMKWIHNPKIKVRYEAEEVKSRSIKDFINKNLKSHKIYGKDQNIYDCPIYNKIYDKIKVEEECRYCRYFIGEYEGVYETGDEKPKYPFTTLDCVGHKAFEFNKLLKSAGVIIED